jgi:saccharopine dehydrogenase-like NADP-dependent oxidoreductase
MKITVLGAGLVGGAMVKDLAKESKYQVNAVDLNQAALDKLAGIENVTTRQADLRAPGAVAAQISGSDLVINAVPGFMGFSVLEQIIEAGINAVDIAFFPENALLLDKKAKEKNVTVVVDCGVAPGLCNIIAGRVNRLLDTASSYTCLVGGLPAERRWPYEYKAVFSPADVVEEYIRPARFIEHGEQVIRPALSDVELIDFPGVGTLEAFNTDGLRSLIHTLALPNMKEKTMRYTGHAELMRVFRESGFFSTEPLQVGEASLRPLDFTSKLLFNQWLLQEGEEDFTAMLVELEGLVDGNQVRYTYHLLDRYDQASQTHSMARTTGYTATIVARQVLNGLFDRKGINPPEYLGEVEACYHDLLAEYAKRGIQVQEEITAILD